MKRAFAILLTALLGMSAHRLSAQVLTLLHTFTNSDGAQPYAGLTASGNTLFGTTQAGGTNGDGVVFTVNTDGTGFGVLHAFSGPDGAAITAGLLLTGNTLYGAASQGGADSEGTLFSLATDGTNFIDNHTFTGRPDGGTPKAGLLLSGNILYGTTYAGTENVHGTVFSATTNGANFTPLHTFTGEPDGMGPQGDLVLAGNVLYGTTYTGGVSNLGTIFRVQTNGSNFLLLHSFSNTDGTFPAAGLVLSDGTLYGTAQRGGNDDVGTVFSIGTNGGNFTMLYSFVQVVGSVNTDGANPLAGLCLSRKVLYGTTSAGGPYSGGTVFSIDPNGSNYTQLFGFGENSLDGLEPADRLVPVGNSLYGTTEAGGGGQAGTVFGLQIRGVAFTTAPVGETNVAPDSDVFFSAGAFSITDPASTLRYQWRINGVDVPGATDAQVSFPDSQPTNGGSLTLTISDGTDANTSVPVGFSVAIQTAATGNNNFAGRFLLGEAPSGVVSSSNTNATRQPGEPQILPGNPGGKSIWFQWQPSVSGTAVFTTRGSDFDTIMGVYTGTNLAGLTRVPSAINDDDYGGYLTSRVSFNCVAGTDYQIVVDGYWGASGNVVLNWVTENFPQLLPSILQAPPRQTVVSNGASVTFVCQPSIGVPVWLFNGASTGVSGTNFTISAAAAANVGTYVAQVTAGGGVTYTEPARLQISVLEDGATDTNSAAWDKFLDSANAAYSNPGPSSLRKLDGGGDTRGFSVAQTFSTVGAMGEPGEPSIDGQIGGAPVWYTYVTPTNGALLINTAGSSFNTLLGVFIGSASSFATLTNIGAGYTTNRLHDGQPVVVIPGEPQGQTNYIVVDGYNGASGTARLNLYLGAPVVIDAPPQNQFAMIGSNATFTVSASGSTPLYYSWQFNGTTIADATRSIMTVSDVQSLNTGVYTANVSNSVSATNSSASLLLGSAPVISNQPASQTVAPGSPVNLSVTAGGTPPPDYQWLFDGNSIGTNGPALSIPDFEAGNQGSYSAIVSNSFGVAVSSNALLLLNTLQLDMPSYSGGAFQVQLVGAAGGKYIFQSSTNLLTWTPLFTNSPTNGFVLLTDTNANQSSHRFYRGVTN